MVLHLSLSAHIHLGKNTIFSHTSNVFSSFLDIFCNEKPIIILLQSHDNLKQILVLIVQITEEMKSNELAVLPVKEDENELRDMESISRSITTSVIDDWGAKHEDTLYGYLPASWVCRNR